MSLRRTTVQEDCLASIAWRDLREQGVPTVAARRARCVAILDQRVEELVYRVKLYEPEAHSYTFVTRLARFCATESQMRERSESALKCSMKKK